MTHLAVNRWRAYIVLTALGILIALLRILIPERSLVELGPIALLNTVFSLVFLILIVLLSAGVGLTILAKLVPANLSGLESVTFATGLGFGVIAYSIFALGLAGKLGQSQILLIIAISAIFSRKQIVLVFDMVNDLVSRSPEHFRRLGNLEKGILVTATLIGVIALIQALTPPWGYDALMYHIEGPRLFLEQHRLMPSLNKWYINMPFSIEMLFAIGMAFGSDTFPKLLHLSFATLLTVSTYAFARRLFDSSVGWLALAVLLGMPALPIWAILANIDFGWATFEFFAIYASLIWFQERDRRWLVLAGLFAGLALGSKYLAIFGVAALGFIVIWSYPGRNLRAVLRDAAAFVGPTIIVAAPWYLKNWLWLSDPLFPFLGAGAKIDPERLSAFLAYAKSYGGVHSVKDWLLLPVRIYTNPAAFTEFDPLLSRPSPLFLSLLVLASPLRIRGSKTLLFLLMPAFIRYLLLSSFAGTLNIRFLLASYPLLCVGTAQVMQGLGSRTGLPSALGGTLRALTLIILVGSLLAQVGSLITIRPLSVIAGSESKDQFLRRMVDTYPAKSFVAEELPEGSRVLTTGDGRTYYCREQCLNSDNQFLWLNLITRSGNSSTFQNLMNESGATHLLVSWGDLNFLLKKHDPVGTLQRAVEFLVNDILEKCADPLYEDVNAAVYRLDCR